MSLTTSLEVGLLILLVEFAAIAGAIVFIALRRGRHTEKTQATEITGLVHKVEATTEARREALSAIISETYQFEAEETERVVSDFIERERAFYNAMIGVHLGRGGKTLEDVPSELTKVVAPWLRLTPKNMVSADAVEALASENSALSQELSSTKRVLDELMDEYNAAFHKEQQAQRTAATATPEIDTHDLLSIDDDDLPLAAVSPATTPLPTPPPAATDLFEEEGEIIALDLDMGDTGAAEDLTPNDLDALMENLGTEYAREAAAA
jgi:hypothetical protein